MPLVARKQAGQYWRNIFLAIFFLLVFPLETGATPGRGFVVEATTTSGDKQQIHLYDSSQALLIGAGKYTAGWPNLESVEKELNKLQQALEENGFSVTRVDNPNAKILQTAFEDFIDQYGYQPNNRLLFYFSGHGYTRKEGEKGYLVPVDAPDPLKDERGFLKKALPMSQVLAWARDIEAKHALFMFDSCFSGTVFKQKNFEKPPEHIRTIAAKPVRQFITAGSAGEAVPALSVFTPAFVDAIIYSLGDLNKDGYISGTELGLYLQQEVPRHINQTPQYGKISDYQLSRGDFIFLAGDDPDNVSSSGPPASQPQYRVNAEEELWLAVKESANLADFETYLSEYPSGRFAPVARVKIRALQEQGSPIAVSATSSGPKVGDTYSDPTTDMEFVYIPGGCFQMGQTESEKRQIVHDNGEEYLKYHKNELPRHEVCVDGFYMGKYEVTQGEYRMISSTNPSHFASGSRYPVERVSWDHAQSFIRSLNNQSGKRYRLPTEAEWEYAARAGTTTPFYFGNSINSEQANYNANDETYANGPKGLFRTRTTEVGSFPANGWGLHDMHGNVEEWCSDWYGENYYSSSPKSNPTGPSSGVSRVLRGGHWWTSPRNVRSAARSFKTPDTYGGYYLGFRLLLQIR